MTFRQTHTGKDCYKYSFFPLAIVHRNALQENVATSPSLDLFKASESWLIQVGEFGELQHSKP